MMTFLKWLLPMISAGVFKAITNYFANRNAKIEVARDAVKEEELKTAEATAEIADEQAKNNAIIRGGSRGVAERLRAKQQARVEADTRNAASSSGSADAKSVSAKDSPPVSDSNVGKG